MKTLKYRLPLLFFSLFFLLAFCACGGNSSTTTTAVHTHTYSEVSRTPATCTENGSVLLRCSCGEESNEILFATGHAQTTSVQTPPTATKAGVRKTVCANCDHTETEPILPYGDISVNINADYVTLNQPLTAQLSADVDHSYLKFRWRWDGLKIVSSTDSYTPTTDCLEKRLSVSVYDYEGTLLASDSIFCSKLPVLYIETVNRTPITSKTDYLQASAVLSGSTAYPADQTTLYNGNLEIRIRGNSTSGMAKKPYKIKLEDSTDLFGFGKSKHWLLLANYLDESLVRNVFPQVTATDLGLVAMQNTSVDVVLNGQHVGVYLLSEQIRVDSERLDIFSWENTAEDLAKAFYREQAPNGMTKAQRDALEDSLVQNLSWASSGVFTYNQTSYSVSDYVTLPAKSGGLLIEMSSEYDEISKFKTTQGAPIMFKDPEYLTTNSELFNYGKEYIQAVEDGLYAEDFMTTYRGQRVSWRDLVDMDSLARFWLICEFYTNEIGGKSTYMYIDIDGKLSFGPVWDFDWSAGGESPWFVFASTGFNTKSRTWVCRMLKDPEFARAVYDIYPEFRASITGILEDGGHLDRYYDYLKEAGNKNDDYWLYKRGFEKDYAALRSWLETRIDWFDKQFKDLNTITNALYTATPNNEYETEQKNDSPTRFGMLIYDEEGNVILTRDNDVVQSIATVSKSENSTITVKMNVYSTAALDVDLYINGTKMENVVLSPYHATTNPIRYCEFVIDISDLNTSKTNIIRCVANRSSGHSPYQNTALIKVTD